LDYVNFRRIFERGTAEVIEEDDELLFFRDSVSEAYMLACDDGERAKAVLDKYMDRGIDLLTTTSKEAAYYTLDKYGFDDIEICYQFAYLGEAPEVDPRFTFRTADLGDLETIAASYDQISVDEIAKDIERGVVLMAYENDSGERGGSENGNRENGSSENGGHDGANREDGLAGFIGEHMEGSVGMLYVYPDHRRKGVATALENAKFAEAIKQGLIPFGQVIYDNDASLALQEKRGLTRCGRMIYWTWIDI
jgi:GNAT superfamily N-acetyltransferase